MRRSFKILMTAAATFSGIGVSAAMADGHEGYGTCMNCGPTVQIGASTLFEGTLPGVFDAPNGTGLIEATKYGDSSILLDLDSEGNCGEGPCLSASLTADLMAKEGGTISGVVDNATPEEQTSLQLGMLLTAGSQLQIATDEQSTKSTVQGTLFGQGQQGGIFTGDSGYVNISGDFSGDLYTQQKTDGTVCPTCVDIVRQTNINASGTQSVDVFASGDTSGAGVKAVNLGGMNITMNAVDGFMITSGDQ